jgi:hypothetical protein
MHGKYYSTKVRPTIAASSQHAGAYTAKDVLFGWTAVQIPRGSARLISATAIVRGKGDANGTANPFAMDLWFADDDRNALAASNAVTNAANAGIPTRDLLGSVGLSVPGYREFGDNNMANVVTSGPTIDDGDTTVNKNNIDNLVITPKMTLDVNANPTVMGYSTFYLAGIAQGAFDWQSITAIAESGDAEAATTQAITTDGTSTDNTEQFAIGDVLHIGTTVGEPAADSVIGTVATVATNLVTLEAVSQTALVDGDILYNINPIEIILAFEY